MDNFEKNKPEHNSGNDQKDGGNGNFSDRDSRKPNESERSRGAAEAPKAERRTYYEFDDRMREDPRRRPYYDGRPYYPAKRRGMPDWLRVLIIAILIGVLISYMMGSCVSTIVESFNGSIEMLSGSTKTKDVTVKDAKGDYIGILHIETAISEAGNTSLYNHEYLLESIDAMSMDEKNKGIILYLNTPGGSVYASDELYLALKKYQEATKRPIYSSMQSICASGGYYISANADKIYANRNCWTGSIGVTIGTLYDVSGLLDKLGIKTKTITSGRNKAIGASTEELTEEQQEILQSLVDEAYEQFVGIVSEGREISMKKLKLIADGRIYSAKQALDNGLIDEIGTYEECVQAMKTDYALGADCAVLDFIPADEVSLRSYLGVISDNLEKGSVSSLTAEQIQELIALNNKVEINYMAEELAG